MSSNIDNWAQKQDAIRRDDIQDVVTPKRPELALLTGSCLHTSSSKFDEITISATCTPKPTPTTENLTQLPQTSNICCATTDRLGWRLASGYFAFFMCGWGDGVTGTILPYFMADYHVSYMMSSLLFAGSTLGFVIGTLLLELLVNSLGRFDVEREQWSWIPRVFSRSRPHSTVAFSTSQARLLSLLFSSSVHGAFFVMMGARGGFGGSFAAYSVAAFARAILTGTLNAYYAQVRKQSIGYAYGLWSVGGAISPIVCQAIISMGVPWHKFYFGSLVLSAFNATFLSVTFRPTPAEFDSDLRAAIRETRAHSDEKFWPSNTVSTAEELGDQKNTMHHLRTPPNRNTLAMAVRLPYQWAIGLFALLYCGCETSTQGFMVSYLLGTRSANPRTVGYVTSGFWAGIAVGRFAWGYLITRLNYTQRKYLIQVCIVVGLTMEILIWRVNSNVGDSVATAIIGVVFAPIFPGCLTLANDLLPPEIQMVSMGLISATASFGSSLFSFIAGVVSSAKGVNTLVYITVPLAASVSFLWAFFPSKLPSQR
ncbi:MFS general substrate transporter [Agrocybe pediades]|nr:MFS general substrate transporter [Agrocybe pediades]